VRQIWQKNTTFDNSDVNFCKLLFFYYKTARIRLTFLALYLSKYKQGDKIYKEKFLLKLSPENSKYFYDNQ